MQVKASVVILTARFEREQSSDWRARRGSLRNPSQVQCQGSECIDGVEAPSAIGFPDANEICEVGSFPRVDES